MMGNAATQTPVQVIDIFLQPGGFHFGERQSRIRTLLGSCVAITLWHPRLLIGGMCHYLLPSAGQTKRPADLDGRYADEALLLFIRELARTGTRPAEYQVKLFGGGNQFLEQAQVESHYSVPDRNIAAGLQLLAAYGFEINAQHVGGTGHRNLILELWSGHVWLKHVAKTAGKIA